ncbi:MAG: TIR domain-containing protein [Patescibacteria group bacterium]|nr:TIR domain-containing protein [Patescibacteria group bacterium]
MKRVFISFAIEDKYARDHLAYQANNAKVPFEFVDMSVKEPWDSSWKTRCRERIKQCDGVIALLSKKTRLADGAKWEMKCAVEEGVPIIGVHIHSDDKGQIPSELEGKRVIEWTWDGIKNFIDRL